MEQFDVNSKTVTSAAVHDRWQLRRNERAAARLVRIIGSGGEPNGIVELTGNIEAIGNTEPP